MNIYEGDRLHPDYLLVSVLFLFIHLFVLNFLLKQGFKISCDLSNCKIYQEIQMSQFSQ